MVSNGAHMPLKSARQVRRTIPPLNGVQRLRAQLEIVFCPAHTLRNPRVRSRSSNPPGWRSFSRSALDYAQMLEPTTTSATCTGVVYVVLDVNRLRQRAVRRTKVSPGWRFASARCERGFVGIDAGVLDQYFLGGRHARLGATLRAGQRLCKLRSRTCALIYPAPATSNFSKPAVAQTGGYLFRDFRGAFRNFLASSNEIGRAYSPSATLGGWSTGC